MKSERPSIKTRETKGFSFIELMMALGVFSFTLIAILGLFASGLTQSRENAARVADAQILTWAEAQIEEAQSEGRLVHLADLRGYFDAGGLEREAADPVAIYEVTVRAATRSNLPGSTRPLSAYIVEITAPARNETLISSHVLWLDS